MKNLNKENRRKGILKKILILLSVVTVIGIAFFLSLGAYLYHHIDYSVDEALFELAKGDRTTKIYYNGGCGAQNTATVSPHLPAGYYPVEWEEQRVVGRENGIFCRYEDIPKSLRDAFVAIEDKRFFDHEGVDWWRTAKAALNYLLHFDNRFGGSSITQQLIKNISSDNELTLTRKAKEICRAIHLEKYHSKEEILELYMNIVPMSKGCVGIGAAAELYYGKEVGELTLAECASIAAVTNSPVRYDPISNPENNRTRRDIILSEMRKQGMISEAAYVEAKESPIRLVNTENRSAVIYSWYTETVVTDVVADLCAEYGLSPSAAEQMVLGGGLRIYTQMHKDAQDYVEQYFSNYQNFPTAFRNGLRMSMAITDPTTGDLLAVVGGVGKKTKNRVFHYATDAVRAPGSALKPLSVYAPAMEEGIITWASVFDDVPVSFSGERGQYTVWPHNSPSVYSGLTDVRTALVHSKNTVAVRVLEKIGAERSFSYLSGKLGLSTLVRSRTTHNGGHVTDLAAAPLALGQLSDGVSVRALTNAYGALSNGGVASKSRSYSLVLDRHGKVLLSNSEEHTRVFSPQTAFLMTEMLRGVVAEGTAASIHLDALVPVAAKTGTSGDTRDKWLVGYTPYAVAGIWCGYEDGSTSVPAAEANTHMQIWDNIMQGLHRQIFLRDTTHARNFPKPSNIIKVTYCKDSGLLPCEACQKDPRGNRVATGYFVRGTEPKSLCDRHVLVEYDAVGRGIATENCPAENRIPVGLLQNIERNFPAEVYVSDAQYVYAPPGEQSSLREGEMYHGKSRVGEEGPFNRSCPLTHKGEYEGGNGVQDPFGWFRRYLKKPRKIS